MRRTAKASVFRDIYQQPYNELTRTKLYNSTKGTLDLIQRLKLVKKLPVHNGCVNSICWNETGELILSGSDDQHLVVTHGYNYKVLTDYKTSHRANIFSAKFLPSSGDTNIISCSGDGIILYTDLLRREETQFNQFNCHSGTTYEVITIPNDPHSFLSCGEDGTVRWFDLRIKNKCTKPQCKDDIMITCPRAVTALSVSPLLPYQLAIGCSDSTVRIFDRRMLSTIASGGADGNHAMKPLCTFTVPSFQDRSYRITSLCFSPEGDELLVSYSSDHLYLFSVKEHDHVKFNTSCTLQCQNREKRTNQRSPPPVRRLRLRGDWSDTGPNARPEREGGTQGEVAQARPTLHATLMQRMTDVLTRMLNDPATRAALSGGGEDSLEREDAQLRRTHRNGSGSNASVAAFSGMINEGASPGGAGNTISDDAMEIEEHRESTTQENEVTDVASTSGLTLSPSRNISVPQLSALSIASSENDYSHSGSVSAQSCCYSSIPDRNNALDLSYMPCNVDPEAEKLEMNQSNLEASGANEGLATQSSQEPIVGGEKVDNESECSNTEHDSASLHPPPMNFFQSNINSLQNKLSTLREGFIERHKSEPAVRLLYSDKSSDNATISLDVADEVTRALNQGNDATVSDSLSNKAFLTKPAGGSKECISVSSGLEPTPGPSHLASTTHMDSKYRKFYNSGGGDDDDYDDDDDDDDDENKANFIYEKSKRSVHSVQEHMEEAINNVRYHNKTAFEDTKSFQPLIKQKYTGHRNARTMIKEATFWGDSYVLSGSDCGHVFIWDRLTGSLVMLLEADRHVVNCLQPHPVLPLLATSGIDYDVKLWAPVQELPCFDKDLAEVLTKRNEVMLEETKDTITVPASFMIRMLACLNQIRRGGRNRTRSARRQATDEHN